MNTYNLPKGYTLTIHPDELPENPREWDNLGTMYFENYPMSRHITGDANAEKPPIKGCVTLKVYAYVHSGIALKVEEAFGCPWDSGLVGVIYVTHEKIREEYGISRVTKKWREKVREYLKGEVETYNRYLEGDIWRFTLENEEGDLEDSCGGFYGDDPLKNGMSDHLPDWVVKALKTDNNPS